MGTIESDRKRVKSVVCLQHLSALQYLRAVSAVEIIRLVHLLLYRPLSLVAPVQEHLLSREVYLLQSLVRDLLSCAVELSAQALLRI